MTSILSTASSTPETPEDVGIVVGRFQTPYLHVGHTDLIARVVNAHKRAIIFLGVSPNKRSRHNPLDFESRRLMILYDFPGVTILPLSDMKEDEAWSKQLDAKIRETCPFASVRLYGGRDSFIAHYLGSLPTTQIDSHIYHSATVLRNEAGHDIRQSADWRAGVIYGAYNQWPKCWPTVDIAPIRHNEDGTYEVLLARKPGEQQYRFIGGFVDPTDCSYEEAARREVSEESGIETGDYEYVCSGLINDWRYRDDVDKVMTTFFTAKYVYGNPNPKDDIEEVAWFTFDRSQRSFYRVDIVQAHTELKKRLAKLSFDKGWDYDSATRNKSIATNG